MFLLRRVIIARTLMGCGGTVAIILIAIHFLSGVQLNISHNIAHFGEASATDAAIKERAAAKGFRTAAASCASGTPTTCDHDSGAAQRLVDDLDKLDYHPNSAAGYRAKDALNAARSVARIAVVPAALRNAAVFLDAAAALADAVVTPELDPTPGYSSEAYFEINADVSELRAVVTACAATSTSCPAAAVLAEGTTRTRRWSGGAHPSGSAREIAADRTLRALVGELNTYSGTVRRAFSASGSVATRRTALTQATSLANRLEAAVKPLG